MAKKSKTYTVHKDKLVKSRKKFREAIEKQLNIGKELVSREITMPSQLNSLHDDFTMWNNFNEELLKRSFDRPNNDYHKEYCWSPGIHMETMGAANSFPQSIQSQRAEINKQQKRLTLIHQKIDLMDTDEVDEVDIDITKEALKILTNLFSKFHRIAQKLRERHAKRETIVIKDEYDVQDLLRALLYEHFKDIREEDYVPSYAGSNSRVDFLLKNERLVIETKMTNDHLKDREVGDQLLIDIAKYENHPDCDTLVLFIYDKGDHISNKHGIINDLDRRSTKNLRVKTFINPE